MKRALLRGIGGLWILLVLGLLLNSSRWAPHPAGSLKMIAHRGVHHLYDPTGVGRDDCTAVRMLPGQDKLEIFENSIHSIRAAVTAKADMVEVDVAPTRDGRMVLFHDWTVDCRTDGKGDTRDLTLAELKRLDIGHGYSADGGRSFPLRGKGIGKIPTVEEALAAESGKPFLFNFKSKDAAEVPRRVDLDNRGNQDLYQGLCMDGLVRDHARQLPRAHFGGTAGLSVGDGWLAQPHDRADGGGRRPHSDHRAAGRRLRSRPDAGRAAGRDSQQL